MAETRKQKTGFYISDGTRRQADDLQDHFGENFTEVMTRAIQNLHASVFPEQTSPILEDHYLALEFAERWLDSQEIPKDWVLNNIVFVWLDDALDDGPRWYIYDGNSNEGELAEEMDRDRRLLLCPFLQELPSPEVLRGYLSASDRE